MGTRLAAGILAAARQGGVTPTGLLPAIDTTPEPLSTSLAPPAYRSGLRSAANPSSLTAPPRREIGEARAVRLSSPHHLRRDAAVARRARAARRPGIGGRPRPPTVMALSPRGPAPPHRRKPGYGGRAEPRTDDGLSPRAPGTPDRH